MAEKPGIISPPPDVVAEQDVGRAGLVVDGADRGRRTGSGAPLGALDDGGAEALGEGDAPLGAAGDDREGEDREQGVASQCLAWRPDAASAGPVP